MPRSPLTEKFLRIVALRDEVKTWPQDEQDFFLDMLAPEPAKKPQKKSSKKAAGGKSKRGESLRQQMTSTLKPLADVVNQPRCTAMIDDNGGEMECGETVDHNSHHKQTDPGYHEFQPPASSAAGASGW